MNILWLDKSNLDRVTNEIIAYAFTISNEQTCEFIKPINNMQPNYSKWWLRNSCTHVHHNAHTKQTHHKYGFPFLTHLMQVCFQCTNKQMIVPT
jgi:hypothetical protein